MSFQIECPDCGRRPVWEFHYGGPVQERPTPDSDTDTWIDYLYNKPNLRGVQTEWWYHRSACKGWFVVQRDTQLNKVLKTGRHQPQQSIGDC